MLRLAYQLPHLKKIGMLVLPRINLKDAGAMRVVKQMGPAILGVSVSQDLPYHQYHFRLIPRVGLGVVDVLCRPPDGVSSGVLGVALGTILLPSLSKASPAVTMTSIAG